MQDWSLAHEIQLQRRHGGGFIHKVDRPNAPSERPPGYRVTVPKRNVPKRHGVGPHSGTPRFPAVPGAMPRPDPSVDSSAHYGSGAISELLQIVREMQYQMGSQQAQITALVHEVRSLRCGMQQQQPHPPAPPQHPPYPPQLPPHYSGRGVLRSLPKYFE